jgi:two-component system cell cycle sensor histidine kinase/response regulator CckA
MNVLGNSGMKHLSRRDIASAAVPIATVAVLSIAMGYLPGLPGPLSIIMKAIGSTIALALAVQFAGMALFWIRERVHVLVLSPSVVNDVSIAVLTDIKGETLLANSTARMRSGSGGRTTLVSLLATYVADLDGVIPDLISSSASIGHTSREITHDGLPARLTVQKVAGNLLLWRVELPVEGLLQTIMSRSPIPLIEAAQSGRWLWQNAAAMQLLGSENTKSAKRMAAVETSGVIILLDTVSGLMDCFVSFSVMPDGGRRYLISPAIRGEQDRRLEILETLPLALARLTRKGDVLWANGSAKELLSLPNSLPLPLGEHLRSDEGTSVSQWVKSFYRGKLKARSRIFTLDVDGQEQFVQMTLSPIVENGREILFAIFNDAAELKALEAQAVQGQKLQAIGQLAGGIAHDFNNLLTAISGHCDLLLLRHDHGDEDYADLIQINQNANRAAALVSQLLAFSRKQSMNPETLDLRDTLSDLTHLLNRLVGEKVNLVLTHEADLFRTRADKRKFEQVMMNLVVNARDAMPTGGEVRVSTMNMNLPTEIQRQRATIPAGKYVQVTIADDGVGIPVETLPSIFDPFFTTKKVGEGTGLGLSLVYGIVKQSGGFIFVESKVGVGTKFVLMLPAEDASDLPADKAIAPPAPLQKLTAPQAPSAGPAAGETGVVLLVEDEAPVRAFATRALRLKGLTVLDAASGEEALEILNDPTLHIDVFVTDVVMPGLDGPSWVRKAWVDRPDTRVIFVSGYTESALDGTDVENSNSIFLPKPFSLEQLTRTVRQQLAERADTP